MKSKANFLLAFIFILSTVSCQSQKILDENSFNYQGITQLEVEGSFCDVNIRGVESDQLEFEGIIEGT